MADKRRFPAPWHVRVFDGGFTVHDANGVWVATVNGYDDTQRAYRGWDKLTTEEARKIALAIAKLPGLLRNPTT